LVTYCIENWNTIVSDLKRWSVSLSDMGFVKNAVL
jgi:hypothetical protein